MRLIYLLLAKCEFLSENQNTESYSLPENGHTRSAIRKSSALANVSPLVTVFTLVIGEAETLGPRMVSRPNYLDMFGERVGPPDSTVIDMRVFPPALSAEHSTPMGNGSGRTCQRMVALRQRVGFCVLVLRQELAFRKKQIYLPLAFVVTLKYFFCKICFLLRNFSETNDRSYSLLLNVPLVVYSGRWAVKCSRACYTGF